LGDKTESYQCCNAITYFLQLGDYTFPKITMRIIPPDGTNGLNLGSWLTD